ncbi:MAG: DMT family transporter [Psittacicella sp.]
MLKKTSHSIVFSISLMILVSLCFSIMSACIKEAGYIPIGEKLFIRNLVLLATTLFIIIKNKAPIFGYKNNRVFLVLRGIFGTVGILASFYAINFMLLPTVTIFSDLNVFFIVFFSFIFLKEKVNIIQFLALVVAFIGILFVVHPNSHLTLKIILIALIAPIAAGAEIATVRYLVIKKVPEHPATIVFYLGFISLFFTVPSMLFHFVPLTLKQVFFLLLAGVAISIAIVAETIAYKYAASKDIAIFRYTGVIFSALISFIFFNGFPEEIQYVGYILIIIGAIIAFLCDQYLCYRKKCMSNKLNPKPHKLYKISENLDSK